MGVSDRIASSAIRLSLTYDNTIEEAEKVIKAVQETVEALRKVMK